MSMVISTTVSAVWPHVIYKSYFFAVYDMMWDVNADAKGVHNVQLCVYVCTNILVLLH